MNDYQHITGYQQELFRSLRQEMEESLGDRLIVSEGTYSLLPKTVEEAKAQGYSLLDNLPGEGQIAHAACFAHDNAVHDGKLLHPIVTQGVPWHGLPFLPTHGSISGEMMGPVLESISPQVSPLGTPGTRPSGHGLRALEPTHLVHSPPPRTSQQAERASWQMVPGSLASKLSS